MIGKTKKIIELSDNVDNPANGRQTNFDSAETSAQMDTMKSELIQSLTKVISSEMSTNENRQKRKQY